MFHPLDHPLERGWVGRIEGDRVIQLAAQTLQSFFTGGGTAREHAEYRLADVQLLAPVLHPPAIRVFADQTTFAFANPAAIVGPDGDVAGSALLPRLAAVIGAEDSLGGFTVFGEWRDPKRPQPKDRDFALGLGPVVVTPDELDPDGVEALVRVDREDRLRGRFDSFDWTAARDLAAEGTVLKPGDILAGPTLGSVEVAPAKAVMLEIEGIGVLQSRVEPLA